MVEEVLEPVEPPPDKFDEFDTEVKERLGGHGDGRGGRGGPGDREPPTFMEEEPYSDYERFSHQKYTLRTAGTVEDIFRTYANRRLASGQLDRLAQSGAWRRFIPVELPPRILNEISRQTRHLVLYIPKGEKQSGDIEVKRGIFPRPEEGFIVVRRPQRWWIIDGQKAERFSRKQTGRGLVPKIDVASYFDLFIRAEGLEGYYNVPFENIPSEAAWKLRQLYWRARDWATKGPPSELDGSPDWRNAAFCFAYSHGQYTEYLRRGHDAGTSLEDLEKGLFTEFYQRTPGECYEHWEFSEKLIRHCRDEIEGQDVQESIQAYEDLADLYSVVLQPARCEVFLTKYKVRDPETNEWVEKQKYQCCTHRATAKAIYCSIYEAHDDRKAVDHINQWLAIRQLADDATLPSSRPVSARDNWYGTAFRAQKLDDLSIWNLVPIDEEVYLGPLGRLIRMAREADRSTSVRVLPGTQIWMNHLTRLVRFVDSAQTLIDLARLVADGGKLTDADLRDKWLPKLINWEVEFVQVWKDENGNIYGEEAPGRTLKALCPVSDWALWIDWSWTVEHDNYYYPTWMRLVNEALEEAGLPADVRVTVANYGRHKDIALSTRGNRPVQSIIARLREVWNTEVSRKTVHIRPVYYKEVLAGLSQELLADLSTPDKPIIERLVADTEAQLRALPTGAVDERKKLEEALRRLTTALPESKELDPLTKFIQHLNRLSDRRFRLWAAFQSHGTKGGIMGFQISEAVTTVKEGYASDNGFPDTENTEVAGDLVHLGWQNTQFNKGVYLARGLSYMIETSASPTARHKAIGGAIIGGLHQDIAHHVAEGFGGMTELLSLRDDGSAARYVKDVFESHEIKRLGRTIVKEIMERLAYRREMDRMKV